MKINVNIPGYEIEKQIGSGTYGKVYKARNIETGTYAAIKVMLRRAEFLEELEALQKLSQSPECNDNIVCMLGHGSGVEKGESYSYIISELMDGDLFNLIYEKLKGPLPLEYVINGFLHLLEGLVKIHNDGFAYRDFKPENILYKDDGALLKIADVGMLCGSRDEGNIPSCEVKGTLYYLAPELIALIGKNISLSKAQKGDVWALGLVFYEMAYGKSAFKRYDEFDNMSIQRVVSYITLLDFDDIEYKLYPESANDEHFSINTLLRKMLTINPEERITSQEALEYLYTMQTSCIIPNFRPNNIRELFISGNEDVNSFFYGKRDEIEGYDDRKLCDVFYMFILFLSTDSEKLCRFFFDNFDERTLIYVLKSIGIEMRRKKEIVCKFMTEYFQERMKIMQVENTDMILKGIRNGAYDESESGFLSEETVEVPYGLTEKAKFLFEQANKIYQAANKVQGLVDFNILHSAVDELNSLIISLTDQPENISDLSDFLILQRQHFIYGKIFK